VEHPQGGGMSAVIIPFAPSIPVAEATEIEVEVIVL
jgi:hypothetical protein